MSGLTRAVLSVAGFDPSAGAGALADVKTCEACGVYACSAITSITYQNDAEFEGLRWLPQDEIVRQIHTLRQRFEFPVVKIGLIESLAAIEATLDALAEDGGKFVALWDPIHRSSAGYCFHSRFDQSELFAVLARIGLVTPNIDEAKAMFPGASSAEEAARTLAEHCPVLLKGGHSSGDEAADLLFADGEVTELRDRRMSGRSKHGSGCVLSSAIASGLMRGMALAEACRFGKDYTRSFLASSPSLLGVHYAPFSMQQRIAGGAR